MTNRKMINISDIKLNPDNPRIKKDDKFKKLVKSIEEFPKMMELRPMVVNEANMVLGGNMRLQALIYLGYKSIPETWVKKASDLTEDEQKRFIISDNVGFGEWDWEILKTEWDEGQLEEWGLDVPDWSDEQPDERDDYQGGGDEQSNMIAVVLSDEDYERWNRLKTQMDKFNDKNVILSLIKHHLNETSIEIRNQKGGL